MASSLGPPSFYTQTNALLRKNLTFQKRNMKSNYLLIANPVIFVLLLVIVQSMFDGFGDESEGAKCGAESSGKIPAAECPIRHPLQWPPLLQVPDPAYRAARSDFLPYPNLPNESCKRDGSCPVTILLTGNNRSFGKTLGENMFMKSLSLYPSDATATLASNVLGSITAPGPSYYFDPGFASIYCIQSECEQGFDEVVSKHESLFNVSEDISCLQGLTLWSRSSSEINDVLYKGYTKGNPKGKINEILAAYDFLNSNQNKFNVSIWYNASYKNNDLESGTSELIRVPRSVNLATNAYLRSLQLPGVQILFDFVKEMPKVFTSNKLDISSVIGTLFFTWIVLQLFPVILTGLVYEKQQKLRIMMKMHGLGDGAYWVISYAYFFFISSAYMFCFVVFGSFMGLKFFSLNSYSIQFVFFFIYINLQIAMAFLVATQFSSVKTASVIGYICVFGTGLIGFSLFQSFVEDQSVSRLLVIIMELYPGFALYRGLYEFAQYVSAATSMGTHGMRWADLSDSENGMKEVLVIMFVEWLVLLAIAYHYDKTASTGVANGPLCFLQNFQKKLLSYFQRPNLGRQGSKFFVQLEKPEVYVQLDKPDVAQERDRVEQLLHNPSTSHVIISDKLRKIHPGRDGNPEKVAVNGLSLALPSGECFGMLGPNGAGKTTFISMMIGITRPTAGTAYVNGFDILNEMDKVYTSMGVCPQYDLLWETLTGREHLLFYGRLKNLEGPALTQAVEESLKNVNLLGVADKPSGQYSGGMKRRLSVAISLIGDPKAVYMDEPSTGLDPASRNSLWNAVKRAKPGRAIILTTHSMEEAEALCDRLGIFVDGNLQCVGNPKELKARYGGYYVFTMTTSVDHEKEVESMVRGLSPGSNKIYQISGTQKYEIPKNEIRVADVFQAVEDAKRRFPVIAWGLADTTLENVFIKVASHAQAFQNS